MFSREELKQNLIGCFEIALFMPNGFERYDSSYSTAVRSFFVSVLLLPLVLWIWVLRSEVEPAAAVVLVHLVRMVMTAVIYLGLVYLLSRQYGRQEHFFKFVTVCNWCEVFGTLLALPVLIALLTGSDMEAWKNYAIFIQLLSYVYTAFIATRVFKLPWEMGGFVAIISLAVMQNLLDFGLYVQDLVTVAV